ncbi:MAG: HEAT repeat domain-containing protein [Planctomycetes bacterium]|jgi:HEAT repeat protein|nr:HEAT repeat domain-containing protein [Planctomycetota bacterium]
MSCRTLLLLVTALPGLAAQTPSDTQKLIAELANDDRWLAAVHGLSAMRATVVPALLAHINERLPFGPEDRSCLMAIYTLGKLGDEAATAARPLLAHLIDADGSLQKQLIWALGEVGPAAAATDAELLDELIRQRPQPGPTHQEWSIARCRIALGINPSAEQLTQFFAKEELGYHVAVADFLLRDTTPLKGENRERLLGLFRRVLATHTQLDPEVPQEVEFRLSFAQEAIAVLNGMDRSVHELARAVAARLPDTKERLPAWMLLVGHFDPDVRLDAVRALGGSGDRQALLALRVALEDGNPAVRREAITALGMLGPLAKDAEDKLRDLATSEDKQVAARAAASLRAVQKKG